MSWKSLVAFAALCVACAGSKSAPPAQPHPPPAPPAKAAATPRATSTATEAAPEPVLPEDVPGCSETETVVINEFREGALLLHQVKLDGTLVKTLFQQAEHVRPGLDFERGLAVGKEGLFELDSGAITGLPQAKRWTYPEFVRGKNWIVSPLQPSSQGAPPLIEIFDYWKKRAVQTLPGYWPSLGPSGELLFLRAEREHVDVMRYVAGNSRRLKRIDLSEPGGPHEVSEVVAMGGDDFLYRISDEHEHRYYRANDQPYFPGDEGHFFDRKTGSSRGGRSKEQYSFVLSGNGAWAAFAERNWNELTYFVIIDRKARQREQTSFYGSFPAWFGDRLLFASDPEFVRTDEPSFRQIVNFAVYAYEPRRKALCRVPAALKGDLVPYGP
jgi:hypothetical protein